MAATYVHARPVLRTRHRPEWSVGHMPLGFRICAFRHGQLGVHVHDRFERVVGAPMNKEAARALVREYARRESWFSFDRLQKVAHGDPP